MSAWKGQVAFITGGASGIGLGMAEASAGMLVTIADIEQRAMAAAAAKLAGKGLSVETVVLDVRDLAAFQAAAEALASRHGRVDLVCNNAGVVFERDAADWTDAGWRWVLDVNLMGVVHGYQAFRPILKRQGHGHFVNTASVTGLLGRAHIGQYGATKFAIVGLSQTMREELSPHGVGVRVLCPGKVMTNIMNATRNAPPQVRANARPATIATPPPTSKPAGLRDVSDAVEVGRMVLAAVEEGVFYILTDLTWAAEISAEQAKLRDGLAWLQMREAAPSQG
jgi:NAD(P)-dependent dehydrogenase (short-subunit alcohol dehydrogenase family)